MELFEEIRQELIKEIEILSKKHNISLFSKIKKEKDYLNLKSLLTEAHFGIYFDTFSTSIRYNHRIFTDSNTAPDFVISANGQDIIMEVCRVNPAQADADIQEAEDFAILEFQKENPGVPVVGNFHKISYRPEKLMGENGSIALKASKYGPLAEIAGKPIIVCIYLDLVSGHNPLDLYHSLYGSSAEFIGEFAFLEYSPKSPFHDIGNGLFYKNEQMRRNISGVLLRNIDGLFIYYHNFSSENRINKLNADFFLTMQHIYR